MQYKVTVNNFTVEFWDDGYPYWTEVFHEGKSLCRVHHSEVRDLEYALMRIREQLVAKLGTSGKHEA